MEEKKLYLVTDDGDDSEYFLYLTKEQLKVLDFIRNICDYCVGYCTIEDVDVVEGFEK